MSREHFKLFTFFNGVFYFGKIIYKIIFMKMLGEYNNNIIYCILWRYFVRSNQLAISVYVVRNIVSLYYTIYVREYDIYFKYLPHMQTYTTSSTFAAATNVSIKDLYTPFFLRRPLFITAGFLRTTPFYFTPIHSSLARILAFESRDQLLFHRAATNACLI